MLSGRIFSTDKDSATPPTPEETANELHQTLAVPKEHKGTALETTGKIALYTAMAILGFSGGMLRLRGIRQNMEFACDAFSKELMGSGKPLASALSKLEEHAVRLHSELFAHMPEAQREKVMKANDFVSSFLHPPIQQRVETLLR